MIRKYVFPIVALLGVALALYMVWHGNQPVPAAQPVAEPAAAPFARFVAGAGMVEANTENIGVSTPVPGLVVQVCVTPGTHVQPGAALFKLDDRDLQAQLLIARANLKVMQDTLARLRTLPRPEDLPPAEAKVREAQGALSDAKAKWDLAASVPDKRAVSAEDLNSRRYAVDVAQARLATAQTQLDLLKAGTWKPDLDIAAAQVAAADAQVQSIQTNIDRLTIRAPVEGEVLQVKVRVGEYAQIGVLSQPMILLGGTKPLHVRVDVDENDAWRVAAGAPAVAYLRGNRDLSTPLRFVRFEPYVIPKRSLTGESAERVDTRVLQVIFAFDKGDLPVYLGQLMDVFIEAKPSAATQAAAK